MKLIPLKSPKNRLLKKTFLSLYLRISENILLIREAKVSKFKLMHNVSQSKCILQLNKRLLFHAMSKVLRFSWDTRYNLCHSFLIGCLNI